MADNSSIQIKKVKSLTDQKIKVEWTETNSDICSIMSGTFNELAAPEFYKAFARLKNAVVNILELDKFKNIDKRITPYGVTFQYSKDGTMGAIISSNLSLPDSGLVTVVNTPMRKCAPDDNAEGIYFTESTTKNLWKLEQETRKYLSGKRAQGSLFGANGQPADANEDTEETDEQEKTSAAGMEVMDPDVAAAGVEDMPADNVVPMAR